MTWWPGAGRRAIDEKLDRILAAIETLTTKETRMSQQLDDLTAQVAATQTVEKAAVTLIQGLAAQLLSDRSRSASESEKVSISRG